MNSAKPKPVRLRLAGKAVLGIAYGLTWYFIAEPTWEYHEGSLISAAPVFVVLPCLVGGTSAFMDYPPGYPGCIAALFSGWISCFLGAFTSIFVGPHYSVAMLYISPILAAASVGSIAVNMWLRRHYPITAKPNAPKKRLPDRFEADRFCARGARGKPTAQPGVRRECVRSNQYARTGDRVVQ